MGKRKDEKDRPWVDVELTPTGVTPRDAADEFDHEDALTRAACPDGKGGRPAVTAEDDLEVALAREGFERAKTEPVDVQQLNTLLDECRSEPQIETRSLERQDTPARRAKVTSQPIARVPVAPLLRHKMPARLRASFMAIDFGTSYSSVAVLVNGRPCVVPVTSDGERRLPSIVALDERGHALVGDPARQMLLTDPANVLSSPKRLLGRSYTDREVEPHLAQLAMTSSAGPNGEIRLQTRRNTYSVAQLCAPILQRLKNLASEHVGGEVKDVVMTVPVTFDDPQRRALSLAATMAGLRVHRFIDEPTAAVLANRQHLRAGTLAAVYDFGGGTFDFSVVDINTNARLSVISNAGDSWLGGDDFDSSLANAAADGFWRQTGVEIRHKAVEWQRLLMVAERAKRDLTSNRSTTVQLDDAAITREGRLDLLMDVSREQFGGLVRELIERTLGTCQTALELCNLKFADLAAVYLSGGTSYVPAVQDAVVHAFGKIPLVTVPPDMAVVLGAASYAAQLEAAA